ncbi:MAG: type II toxin-antitoxin system HigB family toxin [Bryobacteraceae bacterium]
MRVISRRAIRELTRRFPDAHGPLSHWANVVETYEWNAPGDVRKKVTSADFVQDLTVFDIGGNKYRLIAFVHYRRKAVYIKHILTHREYDKGAWKR